MSSSSSEPKKRRVETAPTAPEVTTSMIYEHDQAATPQQILTRPDFTVLEKIPRMIMMDFRSNDEDIVENALLQTSDLFCQNHDKEQNRRDFFDAGGHLAIVTAMDKWHNRPRIQAAACRAIANAAFGLQSHFFREASAKVGSLVAIHWAMKSYSHDENLQLFACGALMNLFLAKENAVQFVNCPGGLDMLFAALKHFPDNRRLHRYVVAALSHLCDNEELMSPIIKAGGIEVLGRAICIFFDDSNEEEKAIRTVAGGTLKKLIKAIPG